MVRTFIAIDIPADLQDAIARQTTNLQNSLPRTLVRWVAARNLHLTLKFLGDVHPADISRLCLGLAEEAGRRQPFMISVGGVGVFPDLRRPRIVWVGLHPPTMLAALQSGIETMATRLGFGPDRRDFSPHLTIGRVQPPPGMEELARIRAAVEGCTFGELETLQVTDVCLFSSDLQPGGPVYKRLYTAPLNSHRTR